MTAPVREIGRVLFRSANTGDLHALKALYAELIPDARPTLEEMASDLEAISSNPSQGLIVVGEIDGEVIATCQIVYYRNLVRSPKGKAVLDSVVVKKTHRHQGIGTSMVKLATDLARGNGCALILIVAASNRLAGHAVYKKVGYKHVGHGYVHTVPEGRLSDDGLNRQSASNAGKCV